MENSPIVVATRRCPSGQVFAVLLAISLLADLSFADPLEVFPDDPLLCEQWYLHNPGVDCEGNAYGLADADIDAPEAWAIMEATEGGVITMAVLDTGLLYEHEDVLSENLWVNGLEDVNGNGAFDYLPASEGGDINGVDEDGNGYIDDVIGYNFVADRQADKTDLCGFGPDNPGDCTGHGTWVMGLLATISDNDLGVASLVDNFGPGSWRVEIMVVKVDLFIVDTAPDVFLEGVRYAVDNGAQVICSTQRMRGGSPPCFMVWNDEGTEALEYARDRGVLFVQGVGNKGCDIDTLEGENVYNAGFDNFIGVASSTNVDELSLETNFGKTLVPVAAPSFQMTTIDIGEPYKIKGGQGTSYSTPVVSGICALIWAAHPDWSYHQVRDALFRSSEYKRSLFPWISHGRVNAAYAVSVQEGVDSDGDGIPDAGDDNCPFRANPIQEDTDADGTGDACDPEIDGDGFPHPADCDDFDPMIHPGAADPCDGIDTDCSGSDGIPEVPGNGVDDDCDGKVDEGCFLRLVMF